MITMGYIGEQLMRRWRGRAWWRRVIADTEFKVTALRGKAVSALNAREISDLRLSVKQRMSSGSRAVFVDIRPHPRLSPCFVGRNEKRRNLLRVLEHNGNHASTQYGSAGKTQQLVPLSESAREHGLVPCGIFGLLRMGRKKKYCLRLFTLSKVLSSAGYRSKPEGILVRRFAR